MNIKRLVIKQLSHTYYAWVKEGIFVRGQFCPYGTFLIRLYVCMYAGDSLIGTRFE